MTSDDHNSNVVTEETKLVPTTRKPKTGDLFTTFETVPHGRSPDVGPEQNQREPDRQKTLTPAKRQQTEGTAVEEFNAITMRRELKTEETTTASETASALQKNSDVTTHYCGE